MPRPKRSKVAPSAPAPRLRTATSKNAAQTVEADSIQVAQQEDAYNISDPDEGLVTNARRVRRSLGKGKGKEVARAPTEEVEEGNDRNAPVEMSGALFDDIDLESSIEMSRRDDNINTPGTRMSLAQFRQRPRQRSILGRRTGRSSSVESNLAQDNLMSVGRKVGASAIRGRQQRAGSLSRFGGGMASSMALDLDRGRMTPAHSTGSVLNLGNFKRRQREPSILGTAQKRREEVDETRGFEIDDDEDDAFEPDGESTPLNFERTRGSGGFGSTPAVAGSSSSKKRKRSVVEDEIQVPQSSENAMTPSVPKASEQIPMTLSSDHEEEESEIESGSEDNELPMASIEHVDDELTPEPQSETMAPPRSSSSPPSSPLSPTLPAPRAARPAISQRGRQLRGRTPPLRTQDSPISSPPSLTHSPNRLGSRRGQSLKPAAPAPSTFSTAQLQTLMPQRRRRARARGRGADPFDVPSSDQEAEIDTSGLAASDDELSHIAVRPRRINALSSSTSTRKSKPKTSKPNKIPLKQPPPSKRTYGIRSTKSAANNTSDKENANAEDEGEGVEEGDSLAPLPDSEVGSESSQQLEARVGRELKVAARKFQEVDRWELEFEDVSASSESWRERDAR